MSRTDFLTLPANLPRPIDDTQPCVCADCEGGRIEQVFYPVFPPDQNAAEVLRWLAAR